MKQKIDMDIFNNLLVQTGFFSLSTAPHNESSDDTTLFYDKKITTLAREKKPLEQYLNRMQEFNILSLKFSHIPIEDHEKQQYLLNTIKKAVKAKLLSYPNQETFREGLFFLKDFIGIYTNTVQISSPDSSQHIGLSLAMNVTNGDIPIMIQFSTLSDLLIFSTTNPKKKKTGYFYFEKKPNDIFYIVDLSILLSYLCLWNTIYQFMIEEPEVTQYFIEKELQKVEYPEHCLQALQDLIQKKTIISPEYLFKICPDNRPYMAPDQNLLKILTNVFFEILSRYEDLKFEISFRKKNNNKIATAYMTKKNIPQYIQQAMKDSTFTKYFEYVEYDEDVDLTSILDLEQEFKKFKTNYFKNLVCNTVKLRFRKLGKHKASGLYYPYLKTLCVDIRTPSSFAHEFFHMIDHLLGDLSWKKNFIPVIELYRQSFLNNMPQLNLSVQTQLKGSSVYNLQYYFRPAEIFARCGELYLIKILNVKSSLLPSELNFAYPCSEKLNDAIQNYFVPLLKQF